MQKRLLAVTIEGYRIYNVYVPNGQSVNSDKYDYKLAWLEAFQRFVQKEQASYQKQIILGDFNIAPTDLDVYDPKVWRDCILVSDKERESLNQLLSLGFYDSFREEHPQKQDCFSWWDYREGRYQKGEGLRIDLILASEGLKNLKQHTSIDKIPRSWPRPSDHCPVVLHLKV